MDLPWYGEIIMRLGTTGTRIVVGVVYAVAILVKTRVRQSLRKPSHLSSMSNKIAIKSLSTAALTGNDNLIVELASGIGRNAEAATDGSIATKRPTLGLRVMSIGLTAALFYYPLSDPDTFYFSAPWMVIFTIGSALYVSV